MEEFLDNGILVHKYGPHIFHTNNGEVFKFLKQYSDWEREMVILSEECEIESLKRERTLKTIASKIL